MAESGRRGAKIRKDVQSFGCYAARKVKCFSLIASPTAPNYRWKQTKETLHLFKDKRFFPASAIEAAGEAEPPCLRSTSHREVAQRQTQHACHR
jgi:hypothetical protein